MGAWLSSPGSAIENEKEIEVESSKMITDSTNMCTGADLNMGLMLGNKVTSLEQQVHLREFNSVLILLIRYMNVKFGVLVHRIQRPSLIGGEQKRLQNGALGR